MIEEAQKRDAFARVLDGLGQGAKIVLIGEGSEREELYNALPAIRNMPWCDRPVDIKTLDKIIEKEML